MRMRTRCMSLTAPAPTQSGRPPHWWAPCMHWHRSPVNGRTAGSGWYAPTARTVQARCCCCFAHHWCSYRQAAPWADRQRRQKPLELDPQAQAHGGHPGEQVRCAAMPFISMDTCRIRTCSQPPTPTRRDGLVRPKHVLSALPHAACDLVNLQPRHCPCHAHAAAAPTPYPCTRRPYLKPHLPHPHPHHNPQVR